MDLTERMVESKTIFEGHIIKVTLDQAMLPDGKLASREVVYHPGGVAVLALDEENRVTLVRQYRYPIGRELLELPAGKLDHGAEEDRLLGAQRELSEETGLEAEEWTYLGYMLASPGFCDEAAAYVPGPGPAPQGTAPGRGRVSGRGNHVLPAAGGPGDGRHHHRCQDRLRLL